ncbi:MAG: hypothetical protein ACRC57_00375 [Sarcina sp.]
MFKRDENEPIDRSIDYSKTKREIIEEKKKLLAQEKMNNDLKPMYGLIDKINHRLEILEDKFYIKYLTDTYIKIEGNIIEGENSKLLEYLLDNLCKVACSNMNMQQTNELTMMPIFYNDKKNMVPSISVIEIEKIVHRINELLAQTDCEIFDVDYYEKTVHKKVEEYTKKDVKNEQEGINRKLDKNNNTRIILIIAIVVLFFIINMH